MKMTIKELMVKIDDISRVMDKLDKMPEHVECTEALGYLEEYIDMLMSIKVDVRCPE